ncbi:MAG: type II secretion system protein [Candidatus Taylorbacteria bacterium]|nr:type II secretion system protein [Candidatus Taylorbacteria bacterium]
MNKQTRAFTLIELLVVIAIVGVLSSVVLASLNSARQKARDVKRVADVKSLQLALALYFDANSKYPGVLGDLTPTYISTVPTPPTTGVSQTDYAYVPLNSTCNSYHLGGALELGSNTVLTNDSDAAAGTVAAAGSCGGTSIAATTDFHGLTTGTTACNSTTSASPDQCFDVTP